MSVFKCKMCGGNLEITEEMSVCECQYCGSKQTLPKINDEKKKNLYDRAGHFRRNNEYDKALAIYEQILNEDPEDAESYWSIVLCRYGIEYVEDPATHRRVPTVNRAQLTSVFSDENYKSAIKYADAMQRTVYEAEAKEIEQIQKGILAISSKEEPFDVFICYKESDATGRRTPDSVLANDLYHQLTQEGFKVFFARITLEDKLGSAYEPYIFAALNSAKVMVVLGTKPEYFTAVWVKNEWSRFLAQIKGGANKVLIPAYKDMDPYNLPEEFSHLQAQDMSKLGFMQDLIRGIKKITGVEEKKAASYAATVEPVAATNGAQALVERAFLFLEDGDFDRADELCEQALNQDPKNSKAYIGKIMVERKIKKQEDLAKGTEELTENNYFQKALRFAEEGLKKELERCNQMIMDNQKDAIYNDAIKLVKEKGVQGGIEAAVQALDKAIGKYESLLGWRDSEAKIEECKEQKNELIYNDALQMVKNNGVQGGIQAAIKVLDKAIDKYESLLGWKDSERQIEACKNQKSVYIEQLYQDTQESVEKLSSKQLDTETIINALQTAIENYEFLGNYQNSKELLKNCKEKKTQQEYILIEKQSQQEKMRRKKRMKKIRRIVTVIAMLALFVAAIIVIPKAIREMQEGDYEKALDLFEETDGYADTEDYINACNNAIEKEKELQKTYNTAMQYKESGAYELAIALFNRQIDYLDSAAQIAECQEQIIELKYQNAISVKTAKDYDAAIAAFKELGEYKDSVAQMEECITLKWEPGYQEALSYMKDEKYNEAIALFNKMYDYKDSADRIKECQSIMGEIQAQATEDDYQKAFLLKNTKQYEAAIKKFKELGDYKDSKKQITECETLIVEEANEKSYQQALEYKNNKKYDEAVAVFETIKDYKDSKEQLTECNNLKIYERAKTYSGLKRYEEAIAEYEKILDFKDSAALLTECENSIIYEKAMTYKNNGLFNDAIAIFETISSFKDSSKQIGECKINLSKINTEIIKRNKKSDAKSIGGNSETFFALKKDGTVLATSEKFDVSDWKNITAISSRYGTNIAGLTTDGTVLTAGWNNNASSPVANWTDITAIDTTVYHIVGITTGGNVKVAAIDSNGVNYTNTNVSDWKDVVDVECSRENIVGIKSDATTVVKGDGLTYRDYRSWSGVNSWNNIAEIEMNGVSFIVGLTTEGKIMRGGSFSYYGYDEGFARFADVELLQIELNDNIVYGLKKDGTVLRNYDLDDEINNWGGIVELFTDDREYSRSDIVVGLKYDGTVVAYDPSGYYNDDCTKVEGWTDIVDIFISYDLIVGLKSDGTIITTNDELNSMVKDWTDIKLPEFK